MTTVLKAFSKADLIKKFSEIYARGWIENYRKGNDGAVGNILEDLLEIPENNLPIPNAAEWELKAQRANTSSLLTMFHSEPSPTALTIIPSLLLPLYGWPHEKAGSKYPDNEKSFRATLNANQYSDRGFKVHVNDTEHKVEVIFYCQYTDTRHSAWLDSVKKRVGHTRNFDIVPYWGFDDLFHKAGTKLKNCFYVRADVKQETKNHSHKEYFLYNYVLKLSHFDQERFIQAIRDGKIYIDFDARTGHNHGTKFRIKYNDIPLLYRDSEIVINHRENVE